MPTSSPAGPLRSSIHKLKQHTAKKAEARFEHMAMTMAEDVPPPDGEDDEDKKEKYKTLGAGSGEMTHMTWGGAKILIYVVLLGMTLAYWSNDYNPRTCVTSSLFSFCLKFNITSRCVDTANFGTDSTNCVNKCELTFGSGIPVNKFGCELIWSLNPDGTTPSPPVYTCFDDKSFPSVCNDVLSCPPKYISSTTTSLLPFAALLLIQLIMEVLHIVALNNFNATHPDEFKDLSRADACLLLLAKGLGFAKQFFCVLLLLVYLYIIYTYSGASPKCSEALNSDQQTLSLWSNVRTLIVVSAFLLSGVMVMGSWVRLNVALRGELFPPSNEAELECPLGLDCSDLRNRPAPKCCSVFWSEQIDDGTLIPKHVAKKMSVFIDYWCGRPVEGLGNCLEICCRERHFLGP